MSSVKFIANRFKERPFRTLWNLAWLPVYFIVVCLLCAVVFINSFSRDSVVDTWYSNM